MHHRKIPIGVHVKTNQFAVYGDVLEKLKSSIESKKNAMPIPPDREAVLREASLVSHWARISAEKITALEFMKFLQPMADLEGLSVSYPYRK